MIEKPIDGVIVPLISPYNLEDLPHLIDHVIKGGISNIFILGTTGEALKLKQNQKIQIIEKASACINKRANLLIGITSFSFKETLDLMKISNEIGATSVIAPLVLGDPKIIIEDLLKKPYGNIILYNNPKISDEKSISLEQVKSFASERRILGIKDSSNNFSYLDELIKFKNDHFKVYFGGESNLKEAFKRKIDGIVPAGANIDPKLFDLLWKIKENCPWGDLTKLREEISKENKNYLQGLKSLLKKRNLISSSQLY